MFTDPQTTKCLRCNGAGSLQVDEPECNGGRTREACERCGGAGWVMHTAPDIENLKFVEERNREEADAQS